MSLRVMTFSSVALVGFLGSVSAFADCTNIVLNMEDENSGRRITTILNCHEASATIPGATTMHFMEWRGGRLCRTTQVCGNVNFWKANVSIGAQWYWGNEISDFTSTVDSWRRFAERNGDRSASGTGSTSGGVYRCADARTWGEFERAGYVNSTAAYRFDREAYVNWERANGNSHEVHGDIDLNHVTFGGSASEWEEFSRSHGRRVGESFEFSGSAGRSWIARHGASAGILACGYLDRSYSGTVAAREGRVIGFDEGRTNTTGSTDVDWDMSGITASVSLDFGQIRRFCSVTRDWGCM